MKDNLNYFEKGRQHQIFEIGRRPQFNNILSRYWSPLMPVQSSSTRFYQQSLSESLSFSQFKLMCLFCSWSIVMHSLQNVSLCALYCPGNLIAFFLLDCGHVFLAHSSDLARRTTSAIWRLFSCEASSTFHNLTQWLADGLTIKQLALFPTYFIWTMQKTFGY